MKNRLCSRILSVALIFVSLFPAFSYTKPSNYFGTVWSNAIEKNVDGRSNALFGSAIDNVYLYTSDYNGRYCVNTDTGEIKWFVESDITAYGACDINPVITKTTVSFITGQGICGYDKKTGKQKWVINSSPCSGLSNPVNNFSVIDLFHGLALIDLEKGIITKTIPHDKYIGQEGIVFRNEKYAVFVNHTFIVLYDLIKQNILFSVDLPEPCHFKPVPLIDNNMLYYYSKKNNQVMVNCYDLAKRTIVWSQNIDFLSNMLISGNKLVTGKVCLDKRNGKVLWANDQINFSSVNCLCDDRITAFLDNGDYVIFKLDTGEITCKDTRLEELGDDRSISSFPIYYKGNIYMTSGTVIYKLGTKINTVSVTVGSNYSVVGKQKVFTDDKPFVKNGVLYVNPVSIIEPLGGRVGGFSTKQYHNCIFNDKVVRLLKTKSDSKDNNVIDGCIEVNNTIFVPLRKLTNAFDLKLKWDAKTRTAAITK